MNKQGLSQVSELEVSLEAEMFKIYGSLIGGQELTKVLGFKTSAAFRQALSKDVIGVPVFQIDNRKGKFALTRDVIAWLVAQRNKNLIQHGD